MTVAAFVWEVPDYRDWAVRVMSPDCQEDLDLVTTVKGWMSFLLRTGRTAKNPEGGGHLHLHRLFIMFAWSHGHLPGTDDDYVKLMA